ncbi:hypothetical protein [Catenovulum adriaticum]|uniref:Lipoprotein n=1 Tax=Catenovulum adriaticum TaxID=2984846 RepID=A0ABY7APK4_9ALTE|nr:hypothetical protein [Catenovulum sp. TS8]WAJ71495.1 hypothetical protein OLW01_06775 [Catenovulum sp. TS8]
MKNNIVSLICFITLFITACSQQQAYHATQEMGKNIAKCELIADYLERERCFAQFDKSYEEYKKERDAIINRKQ